MSWTEERVNRLKELWGKGMSASEIAQELTDVSRNAVIGKAHRLGLSGRPSPIKSKPATPPISQPSPMTSSIVSLSERMCKWPIGDPKHKDFHFCGSPSQANLPYCAEHAARAYQTSRRKDDFQKFDVA